MYTEGRYAILKALEQLEIDGFIILLGLFPSIAYEPVTSKNTSKQRPVSISNDSIFFIFFIRRQLVLMSYHVKLEIL